MGIVYKTRKIFIIVSRIDPIVAVVDWELGASTSQSIKSSKSRKNSLLKPHLICSSLADIYNVPAINTWPVGRHLALLNKILNEKIQDMDR